MGDKGNSKLWVRTTITALVFLVFYGVIQYFINKKIEPVSLLIGTVAFWIVFFVIQEAMTKSLEK